MFAKKKKWEEAVEYFKKKGDQYKLELLDEFKGQVISLYHHGNFTDLCRGPHLPSTGKIKAIKLLSVAGAYWRGNEKNKMMQRIYGVTFPSKKNLMSTSSYSKKQSGATIASWVRSWSFFFSHQT